MKKLILILAAVLLTSISYADTYVSGYYKSNGTYVQPHYRSSPNKTSYDNYSTKGNQNPYTGEYGTQSPNTYSTWGSGRSNPYKSNTFGVQESNLGVW